MGATTPPDRRRSLFLFFFSLFYRVRAHRTRDTRQLSPNFHLFIPACSSFRFESIHFRVHFSTIAIIRLALSDRIIEQIDALFLILFIYLFIYVVVASRFIRVTEKFERISSARKIKTIENERNCFLWILAIPTENLAEFQTRYAAMAYL